MDNHRDQLSLLCGNSQCGSGNKATQSVILDLLDATESQYFSSMKLFVETFKSENYKKKA